MNNDLIKESSAYRSAIINLLKRRDLLAFIEQVTGAKLSKSGRRWSSLCPMPHHNDTAPSFFVWKDSNDIWFFKCFGCGSHGTILDFWLSYASSESLTAAIVEICERIGGDSDELILQHITTLKKSFNEELQLEHEHIRTASRCCELWRQFSEDQELSEWIEDLYRRMNKMLAASDRSSLRQVYLDVLEKYRKKVGVNERTISHYKKTDSVCS